MQNFSVGFLVDFRNVFSTILFFPVGFEAFNFTLAMLFLLLTSFIVCQTILDSLSSAGISYLIYLILYVFCLLF